MQSLHIADAGFGYIFRCIGLYYEGNIYFVLYLLSLVFLSVDWKDVIRAEKGGRLKALLSAKGMTGRMRRIFLPQLMMMVLTVYNPVFPVVLNSIFDVNKEYYRFIWMTPVIICVSAAAVGIVTEYAGGELYDKSDNASGNTACGSGNDASAVRRSVFRVRQAICAVFIICLLMAGGTWLYADGYIVSPNVYHMPTEIPEVAEIIHEDALKNNPEDKYPRAMFEYDYNMLIRQYDAGIMLPCDREAYLNAVTGALDYDTIMEDTDYYNRLLAVVALGIEIPEDAFTEGLEETDTEYVVVSTANEVLPYLKGCGLTVVSETANHTVLRYELTDYEPFSLADYSDVWNASPMPYDILM